MIRCREASAPGNGFIDMKTIRAPARMRNWNFRNMEASLFKMISRRLGTLQRLVNVRKQRRDCITALRRVLKRSEKAKGACGSLSVHNRLSATGWGYNSPQLFASGVKGRQHGAAR